MKIVALSSLTDLLRAFCINENNGVKARNIVHLRSVSQHAVSSRLNPQRPVKPGVVTHNCDLSTWAVEAGEPEVGDHPWLLSKSEASL